MALDFKVDYCLRESVSKLLTLRVIPVVDGKEWESSIEVQGATADELEAALRPKMIAAKARYDAAQSLAKTAQERVDVIKAEIGLVGV